MTSIEAIEAFVSYRRHNKGRAIATTEKYRHALERLVEFLGPERELLAATEDQVIAFVGPWLHKRGVLGESKRVYVAAVRTFFKWAVDRREIRESPAAELGYPKTGRRLPDVITLANAEKLMWSPDFTTFKGVRDGAMMALLIGCGIRVTGLVRLDDEDLSQESSGGRERLFVTVHEKGDKQRKLPIPLEADLQLRTYLEHPELKKIDRTTARGRRVLFVTTGNKKIPAEKYRGERRRFNRRSVNQMLRDYGRELGIPDSQLHPHALRHRFGTELAESRIDKTVRQTLMGHADANSGQIYEHLAMHGLVRDIDVGNPLSKMRTPTTDILERLKRLAK